MKMNVDRGPFLERIERIRKRAEQTVRKTPSPRPDSIWARLLYPVSFVGVFFLSIFSALLIRYIAYHAFGVLDTGSRVVQKWVDYGFAAGAFLLRDRKKEYSTVVIAGVLATTFTLHNLVWEYPQVFEILFGEDWVEFTEQRTLPSSLNIFGHNFVFG